jgi:hypothetical protein
MRSAVLFVIALLSFAASFGAWADAVVNSCATDQDHGAPTTSLEDALAVGGVITFNCPAGTVISMRGSHEIKPSTTIDGGGKVSPWTRRAEG